MPEIDSFEKLVSVLKQAADFSSKIERSFTNIEKKAGGAAKGFGGVSGATGGQAGHGTGSRVMPGFSGSGNFLDKVSSWGQAKFAKTSFAKDWAATEPLSLAQSRAGASAAKTASGETSGTFNFASAPGTSGASIQSSTFGLGDTAQFLQNMSSAAADFMPNVGTTMNRATSYYNATLYGGNVMGRKQLEQMTYGTLSGMNGITSPGSDAAVAQFLAGRGMTAKSGANSTYQRTLRSVGNAARYMNISNEQAAASIEGLTSAQGASQMLRNFGIYTADLSTGKEKTQGQIFEELAQRLTAGRGQATVEQTQQSIRRGALGVTIDSFFQGDAQGAQMFKQYMIDRAGGKKMDLSSSTPLDKAIGSAKNINPLNAQLTMANKQTGAMNYAEQPYIQGINDATKALGLLTDVSGGLVQALGRASAMIQTLFGNKSFSGAVSGITSTVEYASKGIGAIVNQAANTTAFNAIPSGLAIAGYAGNMALGLGIVAGTAIAGVANSMSSSGGSGGSAEKYGRGGTSGSTQGFSWSQYSAGKSPIINSSVAPAARPAFNLDYLKSYQVTTVFGVRDDAHSNPHKGTDFGMKTGTPVKAVGPGKVIVAEPGHGNEWPGGGLGNQVQILHTTGDGKQYTSIYGHLSSVSVSTGQQVTTGTIVGYSGNTGRSTGPHLHLEFRAGVGQSGTALSLDDVSKLMTDGSNSNASWDPGSGASSSSGMANIPGMADQSTLDSVLSSAASAAQTPKAAVNAMNILQGLYSGTTSGINAAVQQMATNYGVSSADWARYMAATDVSGITSATSTAAAQAAAANAGQAATTNNNVSITVQVPDVTSADALKFAQLVKNYLDSNSLMSNTGNI